MAESKKNAETSATRVFSRIRRIMPWEDKFLGVKWSENQVTVKREGKDPLAYGFTNVFGPSHTNEDVFDIVGMPLLERVLQGFNAVIIAYGQTGSGKTFTMLGKEKLGVEGLIPKCLQFFADTPNCRTTLSAIEAFGHHPSKITLYDLFKNEGITDWSAKTGSGTLDPKKLEKRQVTPESAQTLILTAHGASHFAPTGKNPESSRGHVAFIVTVEMVVDGMTQASHLICLDLAGSEGETSLAGDFAKKASAATLTARRLEAGCINTGLSQLQVIFGELASKGKLGATVGNGLRRILHPFINNNTYLSVLFCISPSRMNNSSTIATLKFASRACRIKTKPVKAKKKQTLTQLKTVLKEREEQIEDLHADLQDLERNLEVFTENFHRVKDQLNAMYSKIAKSEKKTLKKDAIVGLFDKIAGEFLEVDFDDEDYDDVSFMDKSEVVHFGDHSRKPSSIYYEREKKQVSVALELVEKIEQGDELEAPQSMIEQSSQIMEEVQIVEKDLIDLGTINRDEKAIQRVLDEELLKQVREIRPKSMASDVDAALGLGDSAQSVDQLLAKIAQLELDLSHERQLNKQIQENHQTQLQYVTKKAHAVEKKNQRWYTFFPT